MTREDFFAQIVETVRYLVEETDVPVLFLAGQMLCREDQSYKEFMIPLSTSPERADDPVQCIQFFRTLGSDIPLLVFAATSSVSDTVDLPSSPEEARSLPKGVCLVRYEGLKVSLFMADISRIGSERRMGTLQRIDKKLEGDIFVPPPQWN
jgi:hypothetical protein